MKKKLAFIYIGIFLLFLILDVGKAYAWHVGTSASLPCHEQLSLGALGTAEGEWAQTDQSAGKNLLDAMEERMSLHGVPDDKLTHRWIKEKISGFETEQNISLNRRFVLASLIAGVRAADLEGYHMSMISDLRDFHLSEHNLHEHVLRRSSDPEGEEGDLALLEDSRSYILSLVESAEEFWNRDETPVDTIRWVVMGYGEVEVLAFMPAYFLGRAAHTLQDSYSHTLRDDDFKIVTVLHSPYIQNSYGLPHFNRLDECHITSSDFDLERFKEAQKSTYMFFSSALSAISGTIYESRKTDEVLDEVFEYRRGCNYPDYCDNAWLEIARNEPTNSFLHVWLGCHESNERSAATGFIPLLFVFILLFRAKYRHAKKAPLSA